MKRDTLEVKETDRMRRFGWTAGGTHGVLENTAVVYSLPLQHRNSFILYSQSSARFTQNLLVELATSHTDLYCSYFYWITVFFPLFKHLDVAVREYIWEYRPFWGFNYWELYKPRISVTAQDIKGTIVAMAFIKRQSQESYLSTRVSCISILNSDRCSGGKKKKLAKTVVSLTDQRECWAKILTI